MKTEQYIDDLVRREKETEPAPFLSTRVMVRIENSRPPVGRKVPAWQMVAAVASFAAVALLGITIGNSYADVPREIAMNINDSQIENLGYYHFEEYE